MVHRAHTQQRQRCRDSECAPAHTQQRQRCRGLECPREGAVFRLSSLTSVFRDNCRASRPAQSMMTFGPPRKLRHKQHRPTNRLLTPPLPLLQHRLLVETGGRSLEGPVRERCQWGKHTDPQVAGPLTTGRAIHPTRTRPISCPPRPLLICRTRCTCLP